MGIGNILFTFLKQYTFVFSLKRGSVTCQKYKSMLRLQTKSPVAGSFVPANLRLLKYYGIFAKRFMFNDFEKVAMLISRLQWNIIIWAISILFLLKDFLSGNFNILAICFSTTGQTGTRWRSPSNARHQSTSTSWWPGSRWVVHHHARHALFLDPYLWGILPVAETTLFSRLHFWPCTLRFWGAVGAAPIRYGSS